jgi:hypothetical protein
VTLARGLICTLRSPPVMNGTQNSCPILLTLFISVHATPDPCTGRISENKLFTPIVRVQKIKVGYSKNQWAYCPLSFLATCPCCERHLETAWHYQPHSKHWPRASVTQNYCMHQTSPPPDSTLGRRMLIAPWQPQPLAPEIIGVRINLSRNRIIVRSRKTNTLQRFAPLLYFICWLRHVSAVVCHLQGASGSV